MVFLVARLRSRKNRDAGITDTAADTALVKGTMLADEFGGGENYGSAGRNNTGLHQALYGSGGRQQQMMSLTTSSPPITTTTTAAAAAFTDIGNSSSYYSSSSVGGTSTMPLLLPPGTLLQEPTTSPSSLPPLRPDSILLQTSYIVVQDYLPQLSDEIELRVGDRVVLSACFSDGWAQVRSLDDHRERESESERQR